MEAEKEQGKKRKKRDERPFTQDHFIEKMKNCLFKGLSNPLHLQSAGVLQVSLRLLLSLVEVAIFQFLALHREIFLFISGATELW